MSSVAAIALSGMNAAQTRLQSGAHNIANLNTDGFRRQQVMQSTLPAGGVQAQISRGTVAGHDLAADMVGQMEAKHAFLANLAVFKADDRALGSLLDAVA